MDFKNLYNDSCGSLFSDSCPMKAANYVSNNMQSAGLLDSNYNFTLTYANTWTDGTPQNSGYSTLESYSTYLLDTMEEFQMIDHTLVNDAIVDAVSRNFAANNPGAYIQINEGYTIENVQFNE